MVNTISKQGPDYRVAVVHALEGGHSLGGDLKALDAFAKRGVAIIGLTHFFNKGVASAANPYPYFPDANSAPAHQGLSEFGWLVLKRMEELGIIVDITHCTSTAVADVLEVAKKPLIATHSSVRTLGDHPYSLLDEHIQETARRGGIIGIILYPYVLSNYSTINLAKEHGSLKDVVRTIRYVYKICGTHKCIGIGSDFSGFIAGPKEISWLDEIDRLRRMLLEEFDHDVRMVEDMMAQNVIDFLLQNWKSGI
jgi:membrane dipeptidase